MEPIKKMKCNILLDVGEGEKMERSFHRKSGHSVPVGVSGVCQWVCVRGVPVGVSGVCQWVCGSVPKDDLYDTYCIAIHSNMLKVSDTLNLNRFRCVHLRREEKICFYVKWSSL